MVTPEQAAEVLGLQACSAAGCECRASAVRKRGPSHCPICLEQPNLALRVRGAEVFCKAGCDQGELLVALGLVCLKLGTETQPVTDSKIGTVTHRRYRRQSCASCGKRLDHGRRDRLVCGDACRQRRHRAQNRVSACRDHASGPSSPPIPP